MLPPQVIGTSMTHANIPYQQQRLNRLVNQNPSRYQNVQQNNRQRVVMKQSSGGQLEVAGAVVGIWGANYSMASTGNPYMGRGNMIPPQNVKLNIPKNGTIKLFRTCLFLGDASYRWSRFFIST